MTFELTHTAAAFAGLLSFLSPCILPIVPFYLCYLAGISFATLTDTAEASAGARRRVIVSSIFFALGVTLIFVGLGATASLVGQQLRAWYDILRLVAAAVILLLALHFLGVVRVGLLNRAAQIDVGTGTTTYLGAFLIGMAFAFGWTPCVGPILAAILFTAAAAETALQGASLLLAYALGMTAPFVLAAAFIGPFLRWAAGFRRRLPMIERGMGAGLLVFSGLLATDSVQVIADWMLAIAPDIGTLQ